MSNSRSRKIDFPIRGITENTPYGTIPDGYTTRALNTLGFDTLSGRLRGGKRPGTARPIQAPVVDGEPIEALGQITLTSSAFVDGGNFFTDPDWPDEDWGWETDPTDDWVDPEWPPPDDPWIPVAPPPVGGSEISVTAVVDADTIDLSWSV